MRIKATLKRSDETTDDIVVTVDAGATIGEVAATIARVDPLGRRTDAEKPMTLLAQLPGQESPVLLPHDAIVGEAWIGSGAVISIVDPASPEYFGPRPSVPKASVEIDGNPDKHFDLVEGSYLVGRGQHCPIRLDDKLVSHTHLRIDVSDVVEIVDLGSANGTLVDGGHVTRTRVEKTQRLLVGNTTITVEALPGVLTGVTPKAGPVPFNRSPRVEERYAGEVYQAPPVPAEQEKRSFPYLTLLAPILLGGGLFFMTQQPRALLFILMSPLMMIGGYLNQSGAQKRRRKRDIARFSESLEGLRQTLGSEVETERAVRLREVPSTLEAFAQAMRLQPLLWTRRPEHWNFLTVRFGTGTMESRNSVKASEGGVLLPEYKAKLDEVVNTYKHISGVPVIENLYDAGAIGFAGDHLLISGVVNSVLVQIAGMHSPADIVIAGMVTPEWSSTLGWLKWIPHTSSPQSPIDTHPLADSPSSAASLVAALEELIASRAKDKKAQWRGAMGGGDAAMEQGAKVGEQNTGGTKATLPAIVVVICDDIDVERARLVQIAERGPDAGVFPLWIAPRSEQLPAACRTFVTRGPDLQAVGMVRLGNWITDIVFDEIDAEAALGFGRRLAPVYDAGALTEDSSDLPRSIAMPALLGHEVFESAQSVVDRWKQNQSIVERDKRPVPRKRAGGLRATVGSLGVDALHIDLRANGPHALVGGTTGSGKSEFLQAWVLAMAAEYSPDRVTFLFVDYKGGSAFAECVHLPHCVGLVTDLSPHLVIRALTSLRAELHYREHLFNRRKAKDILELEKRGDPQCPPALVIVIDEFAALVGDVPEFVDGVVDVAQRGRSLGIHLVMATQRPAGVIKDNLRANTNLRVALRMADTADSTDVVDVKDAAFFDPELPGRGVVKTGPGRVQAFQTAYAGGWTTREPQRASIEVARLRFGGEIRWEEPVERAATTDEELGPNDQQRLVANTVQACAIAGIPAPRRPWLEPLADAYDLTKLLQREDTKILIGVADIPERQVQEPVYFVPDVDGHMGIYGTGGAGKSTALRTLAAAAGITPRRGKVFVYALDFAAGALKMIEDLPHVGAVVRGEDTERIVGLFRMLKAELARRSTAFAAVSASNVVEYRQQARDPGMPRIMLLIDGFPAFRDDFEVGAGRAEWYEVFRDILADGRGLGMHVVFTADRSGAVPTYVRSLVQRNLLLRLADDGYVAFGAPKDIITPTSPPGRAIVNATEVQVAVIGGTTVVADQALATKKLGASARARGVQEAPAIRALPAEYGPGELPDAVDGRPVLGLDSGDIAPLPFDPSGTFILAGPSGSGRSNAMVAIARAVTRANPGARCYLFSQGRSDIAEAFPWEDIATTIDKAAALAEELLAAVGDEDTEPGIVLVIEGFVEYRQTPVEKPLQALIKAIRNSEHLLIAEGETSAWNTLGPLITEMKNGRRGLVLQPQAVDGDNILKTSLPRAGKGEYPPGRGEYAARGKHVRVQLPLIVKS